MKSLKKMVLFLGVCAVLVACGVGGGAIVQQVIDPPKAEALQGITGIDALMGAACPANWRRSAPHLCTASPWQTPANLVSDNTCRSLNLNTSFGVSTASQLAVISYGHNTAAVFNTHTVYSDSACTVLATSWGQNSAMYGFQYTVPLINGVMYYKSQLTTLPTVTVAAYYD